MLVEKSIFIHLALRSLIILFAAYSGSGIGGVIFKYAVNTERSPLDLLTSFHPSIPLATTLVLPPFIPFVNILWLFIWAISLFYVVTLKCPFWVAILAFCGFVALGFLVPNSWRT
jgi:hypothetical protein